MRVNKKGYKMRISNGSWSFIAYFSLFPQGRFALSVHYLLRVGCIFCEFKCNILAETNLKYEM